MEKYASLDWENLSSKGLFKKRETRFRIGRSRYKVVVLPPCVTLRGNTFKLLREFVDWGGKVAALEPTPTMVDCEESDELKELISNIEVIPFNTDALKAKLKSICDPKVSMSDSKDSKSLPIYYQHRVVDSKEIYLLCNTDKI